MLKPSHLPILPFSYGLVEVKFKQHGVNAVEVVDNGSGIPEKDHDSIGTPTLRTV